jgi:hypothetical protein
VWWRGGGAGGPVGEEEEEEEEKEAGKGGSIFSRKREIDSCMRWIERSISKAAALCCCSGFRLIGVK